MKKTSFVNILLCGGILFASCSEDVVVESGGSGTSGSASEKEEEVVLPVGVDSIFQYEGSALVYKYVNEYNKKGYTTKETGYTILNGQLVKGSTLEFTYDANDSITCESTINELNNTYKKLEYAYDAKGRKISMQLYDWTAESWGDVFQQEEYSYDTKGNLVQTTGKYFSMNPWDQDYKVTYTLDGYDNVIYEKKEKWDGYSWYKNYSNSYKLEYDSNKRIISKIKQSDYALESRDTYTYDDAGNMTSWIYAYHTNDGNWIDSEKLVYTYNSRNKPLSRIVYVKNNNGWNINNKIVYTYDKDVYLKMTEYSFTSESGVRSGRIEYYYTLLSAD